MQYGLLIVEGGNTMRPSLPNFIRLQPETIQNEKLASYWRPYTQT